MGGWQGSLTVSSIEECATPVPSLLEEAPLATQEPPLSPTLSPTLSLEEHNHINSAGKLNN